jgi:hypothetical protein
MLRNVTLGREVLAPFVWDGTMVEPSATET